MQVIMANVKKTQVSVLVLLILFEYKTSLTYRTVCLTEYIKCKIAPCTLFVLSVC